jgi:phage baseplate assembly protein W
MERPTRPTTKELQQVLFSDFTNNLGIHPITGNLTRVVNRESVKQALRNLILTNTGERLYNYTMGMDINRLLFETIIDETDTYIIREKIIKNIKRYEPRVDLVDVEILTETDADNKTNSVTGLPLKMNDLRNPMGENGNSLIINIVFKIINTTELLSLNLLLERNR